MGLQSYPLKNLQYSGDVDRKSQTRTRIPEWEEHLVIRAQKGEHVAFDLLMDMFRPAINAQAMRMLRDPEDAQDAVQDTVVKACRAIRSFEPGRPMLPWLLRICSNCCVDIIRSRKTVVDNIETYEHALSDVRIDVSADLERSVGAEWVHDAVERLPRKYREIIVMRHFRHMDVMQIAEALDKPEGTIKSWLFRARALLKKDLSGVMAA